MKATNLPTESADQATISINESRQGSRATNQPTQSASAETTGQSDPPVRAKDSFLLRAASQYLPPLIVLVLLIGLWQAIIVINNVPAFLVPTPFGVVKGFQDNAGMLLSASVYTLRDALAGFALAVLAGVLVAMALAQ